MTNKRPLTHITGVALIKDRPFHYIASGNDGSLTYGMFYLTQGGRIAAFPTLERIKILHPDQELLIVGSLPFGKLAKG